MPGTKIINVLKDDTFKDILELFRKTDAEDVVFVLPKRSAVFKREDHFAAFASEAKRTEKKVSIMCANADVNDWARKYDFAVIAKKESKPQATLAVQMSDDDEEARDPNRDAYDTDVAATSDESTGVLNEDAQDEEDGMHVADEDAEPSLDDEDDENDTENTSEDDDTGDDESEAFEKTLQRYGGNDMDLYDAEGNLIFSQGKPVTATLAVARPLDGVRSGGVGSTVKIKAGKSKTMKVGVKAQPDELSDDAAEELFEESDTPDDEPAQKTAPKKDADSGELDYIDAVWRDTVGEEEEGESPKSTSRWSKLFSADPKKKPSRRGHPVGRHMSGKGRTILTTIVAAIALVGGAVLILGLGKATVEVTPVSRDLEFQVSVQASDAFGEVDPLFNKIPGQLFEIEKTAEREFKATGSQEVAAKAKGTITVQNEFSAESQTLIATTRFEDNTGRVFRTLQTVTVPGKSGDTAGAVDVDVIADKPGPEYNIEAGNFTIPAFKEQGLSDRFAGITGASKKPFVGGALGLSGIVLQEDLDDAIAQITQELESEVRQAFEAQAVDLQLINAAQVSVTDVQASAEVDQAVETFTVSATGILSTVGFRNEDLFVLLEDHADRNWQLTVLQEQLELHYDEIRFVEDRGILAFSVTALGKGYVGLDTDQIAADIAGKSRDQVRDYFRGADGVRSSTVLLSPIWVRSVPDSRERIDLKLLFEAPMEP